MNASGAQAAARLAKWFSRTGGNLSMGADAGTSLTEFVDSAPRRGRALQAER